MNTIKSVNHKLPKSGRPVLVFCPQAISTTGWLIGTYWNKKQGGYAHWSVMDMEYGEKKIVTHWTELPKKP